MAQGAPLHNSSEGPAIIIFSWFLKKNTIEQNGVRDSTIKKRIVNGVGRICVLFVGGSLKDDDIIRDR